VPPFSDQALVDARLGTKRILTVDELAVAIGSDSEAEFVVDPLARRRGLGTRLLSELIERSSPGLLVWAHGDSAGARALAGRFGFTAVRRLLQLRAPVDASTPAPDPSTSGVRIRTFRPGEDDDAWVRVNARAFATHPEQGRVTATELHELAAEEWFDPSAFLLAWEGDALTGYCWLKLGTNEAEIYVLGVDPDRQGAGLGRLLLAVGLDELRRRGVATVDLYVEADNAPALALYRRFGFTEHGVDVQYRHSRKGTRP
jgi:mycothiol synthase